jgi:hypothetical protein
MLECAQVDNSEPFYALTDLLAPNFHFSPVFSTMNRIARACSTHIKKQSLKPISGKTTVRSASTTTTTKPATQGTTTTQQAKAIFASRRTTSNVAPTTNSSSGSTQKPSQNNGSGRNTNTQESFAEKFSTASVLIAKFLGLAFFVLGEGALLEFRAV